MIKTKEDLYLYLEEDRLALHKGYKTPKFFTDEIWKYEIALRYREYYTNQKHGVLNKILEKF